MQYIIVRIINIHKLAIAVSISYQLSIANTSYVAI